MQSRLYLIPWGLLRAAPQSAFCAMCRGWAGELVGAMGVLGQRWAQMGWQGFQALISFLVRFPKAKDKGEKVWHINTSWISEDKNRFWLYFSKNWGHCGLMTGWKAHHSIFFPIFFLFFLFFPRWTEGADFWYIGCVKLVTAYSGLEICGPGVKAQHQRLGLPAQVVRIWSILP